MDKKDIQKNVKQLAISLRCGESVGNIPNISKHLKILKKAYNIILSKVSDKENLYECEKWLYENYYSCVIDIRQSDYKSFARLTHKKNNARIIEVARFIVAVTNCSADSENIKDIIEEFNSYTPLHFDEIKSLEKAMAYALIERMSGVAKRIILMSKLKDSAVSDKEPVKRLCKYDEYLYFYKHSGKRLEEKYFYKINDINIENIDMSFACNMTDNTIIMSNCINSIKKLKDIFMSKYVIKLCHIYDLMAQDSTFANMDICSQYAYIEAVEKLSGLYGASQKAITTSAMTLAKTYNVHFGEIIFDYRYAIKGYLHSFTPQLLKKPTTKLDQRLYCSVIILASIALTILSVLFVRDLGLMIMLCIVLPFAFIPISKILTTLIIDNILPARNIARMNYDVLPDEGKTLTIISEYLTSVPQAQKAVKKIKAIANTNRDNNLQYALLVDFAKSDTQNLLSDNEIIECFDELKDSENINVFVRKRVQVKNKWVAFERKRGAINTLNKALLSSNYEDFCFVLKEQQKPEFVVVLDDDTMLLPGSIKQAVNTMLHPLNQKYDMLSFESKYRLSSLKSIWSKKYIYDSGVESYCTYGNFYYKITGRSIFCGKGIYRLEKFNEKLATALPDNKILSHDIIEGAILTTGSLGITAYEDAPDSFVSHSIRENRWKRGDLLLMPYIFSSKVSQPFYRYVMASNIINIFQPIFKLILLLSLLITQNSALILPFVLAVIAPYLINYGLCLNELGNGKRLRYVLIRFGKEVINTIYDIVILPFYVYEGIEIVFKTIIKRIFAKDKLLEWKTFYASQRENSLSKHLSLILPSCILSVILAGIFYNNLFVVIYFSLYVIISIGLFALSKSENYVKGSLKNDDRIFLKDIANKTIQYFDDNLSKNQLICDNYQFNPMTQANSFTSPTNIGFVLLAHISAYKLSRIDMNTCIEKLSKTIQLIEELPKNHGHLYNWYSLDNHKALEPYFVSSVDSGNFVACMIVAKQFLYDKSKDLYNRLDNIINQVDFDWLFDNQKGRFYIGYNQAEDKFCGHYDMLASESRILCYVASCLKSDTKYWDSLDKKIVKLKGNTLVSWSGTAFEYLMPQIFMCDCSGSLLTKSIKNAICVMSKKKCSGMWGISESGYYEINDKNHYKYKAFGLGQLSLRQADDRCIISPYSTFLALKYIPLKAVDNLRRIQSNGGNCQYGMYEALDMTNGINIVQSVMTHHQGMTLAGIVNAMFEDYFVKLFMSDGAMQGGRIMLEDRMPEYKTKNAQKSDFVYDKACDNNYQKEGESIGFPVVNSITNGNFSAVYDSFGNGYCFASGKYLNKFCNNFYKNNGGYFYIQNDDGLYAPTFAPFRKDKCQYIFRPYENAFINNTNHCKMEVYVPQNQNCEIKKITIYNNSESIKKYRCGYCEEVALADFGAMYSHPAFSDMFVSTEIDTSLNSLIARRQARSYAGDCYSSLTVLGMDNIEYESNLMNFIGRERDFSCPQIFDRDYRKQGVSCGDVLNACLGFIGEVSIMPHEEKHIYCIKFFDEDINSLKNSIENTKNIDYQKYAYENAKQKLSSKIYKYQYNQNISDCVSKLATNILYRPYDLQNLEYMSNHYIKELPMKLQKDVKYIYFEYNNNADLLKTLVYSVIYLNISSLRCNLVVAYECKDDDNESVLRSFIDNTGIDDILSLECLRFFRTNGVDKEIVDNVKMYSFICISNKNTDNDENISYPILEEKNILPNTKCQYGSVIPDIQTICGEGGFDKNGDYIVRQTPKLPYSNVICGEYGGFITTQNGGGFNYFENSNLNRITDWENNPVYDTPCEEVYLSYQGIHRINKLVYGGYVKHGLGISSFVGNINDIRYTLNESIIDDGKAKIIEIELSHLPKNSMADVVFKLNAMLNDLPKKTMLFDKQIYDDTIKIVNALNNRIVYIKCSEKCELLSNLSQFEGVNNKHRFENTRQDFYMPSHAVKINLNKSNTRKIWIALSNDKEYIEKLTFDKISNKIKKQIAIFEELNKFQLCSNDKNLDLLFNKWLAYQVVSSRINGKCGYYQAGGAIGFRDQLQDNLTMLYIDPSRVKNHILYCAKHQYQEGDVQHWWHKPFFGVRTHISDDRLFLPFLTFEYIKVTGDVKILDEMCEYLISSPLNWDEKGRLEIPNQSDYKESLLSHIQKALDITLKYGTHNLLLIGEGDWNDALNEIGISEKGESVWLSMFAVYVLRDFIEYVDERQKSKYIQHLTKLQSALEKAYKDGYFYRATTDFGEVLGCQDCPHFMYDILCQAWSVIADIGNIKMQKSAVNKVAKLIDEKYRIIPLLAPAQTKNHYYGYISSYPQGVRENGGQYTHASVWYVKALAMLNESISINGKSFTPHMMLDMLNPVSRCMDYNLSSAYKGEPYVLAGDIYTNMDNYGRMGWSWYTGSASILYDTIVKDFWGINLKNNTIVFSKPKLDNWDGMSLTYRYLGTIYNITFVKAKEDYIIYNHDKKTKDMTLHLQENMGRYELIVGFR